MEFLIFILLFGISALFAMFEVALVSSRQHKLQDMAAKGSMGARTALRMMSEPEKMFSTVQIVITLVGIVSGAYGGLAFSDGLANELQLLGFSNATAHFLAVSIVVSSITYLTLVFGELFPKTIALNNAEKIAAMLSPFMQLIGLIMYPLVAVLSWSVRLLSKIFGLKKMSQTPVTEDELKILIQQGSDHGVIEKEESDMIKEVFRFGDKTAYQLMTPSSDIVFIDTNDPVEKSLSIVLGSTYSRFPLCDDTIDHVVGIVAVKDILKSFADNQTIDFKSISSPPLFIPEVMSAIDVLELFREKEVHIGIVVNEFGTTEGVVTLHDISESILGDFPAIRENEPPEIFTREDGSMLVDGTIQLDDLMDALKINELPESFESENVSTLGGLAMVQLNKVPTEGDKFEFSGYEFEIMDMDGQRVDKVLVSKME